MPEDEIRLLDKRPADVDPAPQPTFNPDVDEVVLDIDTAVPVRKVIKIVVDDDPRYFHLKAPAEYSTRERKRFSEYGQAIQEFDAMEERHVTQDDLDIYNMALRSLTKLAIPDIDDDTMSKLKPFDHGRIADTVITLFTNSRTVAPEQEQRPTAPTRLRKLRERLISASR